MNDHQDSHRLMIALLLTMVVLAASSFFLKPAPQPRSLNEQAQTEQVPELTAPVILDPAQVLEQSPRVRIETPALSGSINLRGGRLDDLQFKNYHVTLEKKDNVRLFSPSETVHPFQAQAGWIGVEGQALDLPTPDTIWQADSKTLTPENPVTLRWQNAQGIIFEITYAVDENYLFTLTQRIVNNAADRVSVFPFQALRKGNVETESSINANLVHEGVIAYADGELRDPAYQDLADEPIRNFNALGGWYGITRPYWSGALIPAQDVNVNAQIRYDEKITGASVQMAVTYPLQNLNQGESSQIVTHLFAGPKVLEILREYEDALNLSHFDMLVDFGWFYFLTKPFLMALTWFYYLVGNFGVAILLLTVCVKLVMFPLTYKSSKALNRMKDLQPKMMAIKERYQDDPMKFQQEMIALYKKEKVNPAAGCFPILLQIPIFFSLYKVLYIAIEMRHQPFFGWIHDLTAPDPTSIFNVFGLLPYDVPSLGILGFLSIGAWPVLMGMSMYIMQRLNPTPPDKTQAVVLKFLPLMFTFILAHFPAGLVIYWTWNNTLSIVQQAIIRALNVKHGRAK